jgi:hypothetical protein
MDLQLLQETPSVSMYYDADNDWLFVDWRGELTLPLVQESCLALAKCFLKRPYTRILNSNQSVTDFSLNVPHWLYQEFIPLLSQSGIEYLAWVYSPNMLLKPFIDKLVSKIEVPVVNLFDDVESAASWLQHTRFHYPPVPARPCPIARQDALATRIQALSTALGHRALGSQPQYSPLDRQSA